MPSILVVCTGNVCRSPIAEGMLRDALEARFGAAAPRVSSAGTAGWEGSTAMRESVEAAAEYGVDIGSHVARRLGAHHVVTADLVIVMAAEHRDAVSSVLPGVAGRTFTLKEIVRLLEALPPADPRTITAESWTDRVTEADALRRAGSVPTVDDEDVMDPLGMPLPAFRAVAWELHEWVGRLVDGLAGAAPADRAAGGTGVA